MINLPNRKINQLTNQKIHQLTKQKINQLINKKINQLTKQKINQKTHQRINQRADPPMRATREVALSAERTKTAFMAELANIPLFFLSLRTTKHFFLFFSFFFFLFSFFFFLFSFFFFLFYCCFYFVAQPVQRLGLSWLFLSLDDIFAMMMQWKNIRQICSTKRL